MRNPNTGEWVQVFENDWKEKDLYIDDPLHSSYCWGLCYTEDDLEMLVAYRKGGIKGLKEYIDSKKLNATDVILDNLQKLQYTKNRSEENDEV